MTNSIDDFSVLAQACLVAGNVAKSVRDALEQNDEAMIICAWVELETDEQKDGLAVLRSTLNRESKKLFDFPLTVKDGELVAAATRKHKGKASSEGDSAESDNTTTTADSFKRMAGVFAAKATQGEKEMVMRLMTTIMADWD